jgi:hypothetical protein
VLGKARELGFAAEVELYCEEAAALKDSVPRDDQSTPGAETVKSERLTQGSTTDIGLDAPSARITPPMTDPSQDLAHTSTGYDMPLGYQLYGMAVDEYPGIVEHSPMYNPWSGYSAVAYNSNTTATALDMAVQLNETPQTISPS